MLAAIAGWTLRLVPLRGRTRAMSGERARAASSDTAGGHARKFSLRFDAAPELPPAYPERPMPTLTTTQEKLHAHCLRDLARLGAESPRRMADRGRYTPPSNIAHLYHELIHKPLTRAFSWGVPSEEALAAAVAEVEARCGGAGVVDAGAGVGYWTALLRQRGVLVTPTDDAPFGTPQANAGYASVRGIGAMPPFCAVRPFDAAAAAAAAHPRAALLLCWPPWEDRDYDAADAADADATAPQDPAADATSADVAVAVAAAEAEAEARRRKERMGIAALTAFRGDTVLYVGEFDGESGTGGELTGGPALHGALLAGWRLQKVIPLGERWRAHWFGFVDADDYLTIWHRRDPLPPLSQADQEIAAMAAADAAAADAAFAEQWTPEAEKVAWDLRIIAFEKQWNEWEMLARYALERDSSSAVPGEREAVEDVLRNAPAFMALLRARQL